jgi:adenylate kinase
MQRKLIYLTGVPGSGKTTASTILESNFSDIHVIRYGDVIRDKLNEQGASLQHANLRELSSEVITINTLDSVDNTIYSLIQQFINSKNVILESHGVTREDYGFRVTPFKSQHDLLRLNIHAVVYISSPSGIILQRVEQERMGRKEVAEEQLNVNLRVQESMALNCATICGCPLYIVENYSSIEQFKSQLIPLLSTILNIKPTN